MEQKDPQTLIKINKIKQDLNGVYGNGNWKLKNNLNLPNKDIMRRGIGR